MICSSLNLLALVSIILQVDGLLGKMTGTVDVGRSVLADESFVSVKPVEVGNRVA
jgi:hypothetical protein